MPQHLFTPGPTPLPAAVTARLREEPPYHRGPEADALFASVHGQLKEVFFTQQPVLVLGCSGTGGVEAAMLNTLTPDDRVMVFDNGRFAKRWALMLSSLGIPCIRIPVTPGLPVTEDIVVESLQRNPGCSAVWVVHCETSTGTVSDIRTVASAVREHSDALMCVDAVSSIGVHELRMDAWALDVVVASSQKGLTSPAGLAVVSLSDRAWMRARSLERNRTMYFDLMAARAAYERN
ncbi:MAG: pyridoxal-phosphate-dependent aminotransferase family protein, partial [Candidatus Kapaibacterium sp.]